MRFVQQQHESGCVVACFAMMLNVPYKKVHQFIPYFYDLNAHGLWDNDIRALAKKLKLKCKIKYKKRSYEEFRRFFKNVPCIVLVELDCGQHVVIWDGEGRFIDPMDPTQYTPKYPKIRGTIHLTPVLQNVSDK